MPFFVGNKKDRCFSMKMKNGGLNFFYPNLWVPNCSCSIWRILPNTCVENDDAFVFCGRGTGGALCSVSVSRVGLDGIHLCISGEGGLLRASVEEGVLTYWPKAPDGPYAPEGEARSEHLAEPPGLRFARQAAAFLDLVEGRPVEYCTLEQAVHLERLLTRLDQSAQ